MRVRMRPLPFAVEGGDSQPVAGEQPQARHLRRGLRPLDHHHAALLRLLVASLGTLLSAVLLMPFLQRPAVALGVMAEPLDVDLTDGWETISVHSYITLDNKIITSLWCLGLKPCQDQPPGGVVLPQCCE